MDEKSRKGLFICPICALIEPPTKTLAILSFNDDPRWRRLAEAEADSWVVLVKSKWDVCTLDACLTLQQPVVPSKAPIFR